MSERPLDRLRAAITARMNGEPAPAASEPALAPPRGERHVLADIQRIAEVWYAAKRAMPADGDSGAVPTPEALSASAADLDLDVVYVTRDVSRLTEANLPCVLLTRHGSSRLLVARPSDEVFEVEVEGRIERVLAAELAREQSGTLFLVRPKSGRATGAAEETDKAAPGALNLGEGMSVVRTVLSHMFETRRPLMIQLIVAALLSNLFMLALPLFTMAVYDRVIPHAAMETLWALAFGVAIALFVDLAVRYVRLKLSDAVGLSTSLAFQARMYRHLLRAKLEHAPRTAGGITNNVRDLDGICQLVPQLFTSIAVDLPFFVALMVLLALIAGPAALVPVVAIAFLVAIHMIGHGDLKRITEEQAKLGRQQANTLIETVGNIEAVKATASETRLLGQYERQSDETAYLTHQARLWTSFSAQICAAVAQVAVVFVVILSVYQITGGNMTVGALAAATLLVSRALAPVSQLIGHLDRLSQLTHAVTSLAQFLKTDIEEAGDRSRPRSAAIEGRVELVGVRFSYPGDPRPVLDDVTLRVAPGERVGIIGRVGSGKSTLFRLIPRLTEAGAGNVLIDGHDVRQYAPRELRRAIGIMRQDAGLFDDTLRANLTFGLDDVPQRVFDEAVRISGVQDFASRHPKGYGMPVGPRGERLSGGERQAVALARALMGEPRVLLLDEPTAAMDTGLEQRVVRDLADAVRGRTVIVATHRAPVLALVDRVVVMDQGRIIADGPKAEILRKLGHAA